MAEFSFEGQTVDFQYTMKEARDTGICFAKGGTKLKDNWRKFPANMLWARMISNAIRVLCPEVNAGTYTPEEVYDFDDEPKNVTPPKEAPKEKVKEVEEQLSDKGGQAGNQEPAKPETEQKEKPKEEAKEEPKVVDAEVIDTKDPEKCPIEGKALGKPWTAFPIEQLSKLSVIKGQGMTDAHRKAVKAEIEKRKEKG